MKRKTPKKETYRDFGPKGFWLEKDKASGLTALWHKDQKTKEPLKTYPKDSELEAIREVQELNGPEFP